MIVLNGLFGAYVGSLYNEIFGVPTSLFGRSWTSLSPDECDIMYPNNTFAPYDCYPGMLQTNMLWGIDPTWHKSANAITFFNSYKMKISIVVGIIQMSLGIMLSLMNHLKYKDYKKVWFQWLPEVGFFFPIFGYLVFMIFYKWSIDWVGTGLPPPSLLNILIGMFMSPGDLEVELFPGQANFNNYLVIISLISVPFLLLPIPFIESSHHKHEVEQVMKSVKYQEGGKPLTRKQAEKIVGEFEFGDAFVHQVIHTIEFVLGAISNTASYLRLWALSLAHACLAELFWEKVVCGFAISGVGVPALNPICAVIGIYMWVIMSFVVLMVMENLSSFLHALRLQWVEFQNKFYYGDGIKFEIFSFDRLDKSDDE